MSAAKQFDILIVGGGMVGLSMAAALAETKLSIGVIEKATFDDSFFTELLKEQKLSPEDYDIRVSAISPQNQSLLSAFGVWQKIPDCRIADYERMYVWDGEGTGEIEFDAAELAQKKLGSIVENRVIQAALFQSVVANNNIQLLDGQSIIKMDNSGEGVFVSLDGVGEVSTKLLIGADGANSIVRRMLEIPCSEVDYEQVALVATIETELCHRNKALQRFTRFGPVAFLPLPSEKLCSIVWSVDSDKAREIQKYQISEFESGLERAFEFKLGKLSLKSEFQGFPLIKRHAESYIKDRCVLVGDAAHTIHPLAGQGVNLGFQDVECLSRRIKELLEKGRDYSNPLNLTPYQRERKTHNRLTQETMTGFKWLFGSRDMYLTLLRNLGMTKVNNNKQIKNFVAKQAMGT